MKTTTPDRRGAGATQGRGSCITQHNILHNTTAANSSHPYGVYVSKKSKRLTLCMLLLQYDSKIIEIELKATMTIRAKDATGWTVATAMIEYNGFTTTTYNRSIYIIHRWDGNIKIKLLFLLLYNINTVLSLLLC